MAISRPFAVRGSCRSFISLTIGRLDQGGMLADASMDSSLREDEMPGASASASAELVMTAMDAYAAFLLGVCHAEGSPLGALLSNISLVQEDLADAENALGGGPSEAERALPLIQRARGDVADAIKLIGRLKSMLSEVRDVEAGGESPVVFGDLYDCAAKYAGSAMFRGARVTTERAPEIETVTVKGETSLVFRLILGAFAVAARAQRWRMERAHFHINLSSTTSEVFVGIDCGAEANVTPSSQLLAFSELFRKQGGSLSLEDRAGRGVVAATFLR